MRRLVARLLRSPLAAILACVVLGGLVVAGVLALQRSEELPDAPSATVDIVRDFAVAVTTFDYKRIDADTERVLAFGTDAFERDFREVMGGDFASQAAANKRVSVGEVVAGPTVQSTRDGRATMLVILNQRVVSEGEEPNPQIVRVTLLVTAETDDEPLVTGVQVL